MIDREVVLITGTSRGLGKKLAEHYVRNGFQVVGCSRTAVTGLGENYRHFCLDVMDEAKVKDMFFAIEEEFGRLDVLINNAAVHSGSYALLTPFAAVEQLLKINVGATFLFSCEAVKLMKQNKYGRIINFSSVAVALGSPGTSVYGASKAAVEHFTKVLAQEVASYGITVNTLRLSFVEETGMMNALNEKIVADVVGQTVLKRKLKPQEICLMIDQLISRTDQPRSGETILAAGT